MATKDDIDDALQRVAIAALAYYPAVTTDEPEYELADDVTWCTQPLSSLEQPDRERLEILIGQTITDPTQYRQELFGAVLELLEN